MTRRTLIAAAASASIVNARGRFALLELRCYRAMPGRRDDLIAMFEAHFLDAYESAGARILGTFRVEREPDRWVWLRAFRDNEARKAALAGFYGSATWRKRAAACNATIADISDAMLMRPLAGFDPVPATVPTGGDTPATKIILQRFFPAAPAQPADLIAALATADLPNLYPRLPLRTDPCTATFARTPVAGGETMILEPTSRSPLR